MKPSEYILQKSGFELGNTIGSWLLETMLENPEKYMDTERVVMNILKFLDEKFESK